MPSSRSAPTRGLPKGPPLPAAVQTVLWLKRPIETMRACRARYGSSFTLDLAGLGKIVLLCEPDAVRQVFAAGPDALHAGGVNAVLKPLVGSASVLLLDGGEHLRHRKLLLPPFQGERLKSYARAMRAVTERVTASLDAGGPVVLRPLFQRLTLEIILRVVFGFEPGAELDGLRSRLERMLSIGDSSYSGFMLLPFFQRDFPGSPWRRFLEDREQADAAIHAQIRARRAALERGERRDDVLDLLLRARDEQGSPLRDDELRDELVTLLVAGHETTASGLAWAVERIANTPRVESAVRSELARTHAVTRDPDDALAALPYLDATIKEALRSRPVLPLVGRVVNEPAHIAGHDFEVGTVLAPCVYLLHHDPANHPDPDAFRPERFLDRRPDPATWLPFGGGVRRCLGMGFALYEMKLVLQHLFTHFTLTLDEKRPVRVVRRAVSFAPRGGVRVRARAVDGAARHAPARR